MGTKLQLAFVAGLATFASFTCLAKQSSDSGQELVARTKPVRGLYAGTIRTDILAIGGETTGVILITETQGVVELDCGNSRHLQRQAERLHGEKALVTGTYSEFPGVEIEMRRVIRVQAIRPDKGR